MEALETKAFIERYASSSTLPVDRLEEIRRAQVLASLKGFCAPYPFLVPDLVERADDE